jgi:surface polysaccharide O-acyltransferase-like enzyme
MLNSVSLSRVLVPLLGLLVWLLYYLNGRCAYGPKSTKKTAIQLSLVLGAACIFVAQVHLMNRLAPNDAHGSYFAAFVFIECGGALGVLFYTLLRERARSRSKLPNSSNI